VGLEGGGLPLSFLLAACMAWLSACFQEAASLLPSTPILP